MQTVEFRRCEFAGANNYVIPVLTTDSRYAVFFSLRSFRRMGDDAVHLLVQSAYLLTPKQRAPGM